MTIKNGTVSDADEVLNNCIGIPFKNWAQVVYNAEYIGWNSSLRPTEEEELTNMFFDVLTTNDFNSSAGVIYDATRDGWKARGDGTLSPYMDTFTGGGAIASFWTATNFTTDSSIPFNLASFSGYCYGTAIQASDRGSEYQKLTQNTGDLRGKTIEILYTATGSLSSGETSYKINFGGLTTQSQNGNYTHTDYKVKIEPKTGNDSQITYYVDSGAGYGAGTDITPSATGDWLLEIELKVQRAGSGTSTITMKIDSIQVDTWATTGGVSATHTGTGTVLNSIPTWNTANSTAGSFTTTMSANNGSNFESVTENTIHRFTNTGTQIQIKFIPTATEAVDATTAPDSPMLTEYALLYNLGAGSA